VRTKKKYYIETYGCQMNVYDSELVAGILEKSAYERATSPEEADVIFLNTCSVREHAHEKIYARLGVLQRHKEKDPRKVLGVLGCMAQTLKNQLLASKPYVDFVLGPDAYRRLPQLLEHKEHRPDAPVLDTRLSRMEVYEGMFPARREGVSAWISIMRGCDKFCTFCIVPYVRGRERSRAPQSIIAEIENALAEGFQEITLLGQNVNSYRYDGTDFKGLLELVAQIDGLKRIRYTSPHPQDFSRELIELHAREPKLCNHIHFPLQAGSNRVLERMNRTYTREHYLELALEMRERIPDLALSTDLIVGFPGETEADFEETLDIMEQVKFDSAFTFKYSPRPGTKAARFPDQVPEEVKQERLERLIQLQKKHTLERNLQWVGRTVEVLVEKASRKSEEQLQGRTRNNKLVIFAAEDAQPGQFRWVKITGAAGVSLFGELIPTATAAAS